MRSEEMAGLDQHRYGYQGDFAEMDKETARDCQSWNSFELRMYDGVIGRWLTPDPYAQHWSPYLAMGNNPVNRWDPDGGLDGDPKDGDFSADGTQIYDGVNGNWYDLMPEATVWGDRILVPEAPTSLDIDLKWLLIGVGMLYTATPDVPDTPNFDDGGSNDGDEDGGEPKNYVVYRTTKTLNGVSRPYYGITTLTPPISRYRRREEQEERDNFRVLYPALTKTTARGIEQALINLNTDGIHVLTSKRINNLQNSTSPLRRNTYQERLDAGINFLNSETPNWRIDYRESEKY